MTLLWIKAFHIIAMVCWFAGLFYLPRLFVYHALSKDEVSSERFKIMERKLYRGIMTPAAMATVVLGLWMISLNTALLQSTWMQVKLGLVALLIVHHVFCGYWLKQFSRDINTKSDTFFRWFNEMTVLLLIAIIILAVVKPFS